MSLCWDSAVSVATIAEHFGLRSVTVDVARAATDKALRSNAFALAEIPAPGFAIVRSAEELETVASKWSFPVVVKPTDGSSSRGAIKVHRAADMAAAYRYSRRFTSRAEIILNEFIDGHEYSTEGLMIGGSFHPTALSDRIFVHSEQSRYFIEIGDVMPTCLTPQEVDAMFALSERAARALGIRDGVVKGDLICGELNGPMVLEIAARLGGPRFGTEMVPLSNGSNLLRAAIQQALGERIDESLLEHRYQRGMVNRSIFVRPGRIVKISGVDEARTLPGYYDFKWWRQEGLRVGDIVAPCENGCGDIGYLIATGETRSEALGNADRIERTIKVVTA
jgi:biotin carboxylase